MMRRLPFVLWVFGGIGCSAGGASPDPTPTVTLSMLPMSRTNEARTKPGAQISCVNADGAGRETCTAPEQVCCYGDTPKCLVAPPFSAPAVPAGTTEEATQELLGRAAMDHRGAVASACEKSVGSYDGHAACDDSTDCAEGTRCCEQYISSGAPSFSECAASCDVSEICRTDAQCRIPGAACLDGSCRQAPEKVKCGKGFCSKDSRSVAEPRTRSQSARASRSAPRRSARPTSSAAPSATVSRAIVSVE